MRIYHFSLAAALLLLPISGCVSDVDTYPVLVNKGLLPLSTTNPYFGANLFMAREMERSSFLYNFMKAQGAPTAIEIEESRSQPVRIIMYYPRAREVYVAELQHRDKLRQWIVRGPVAFERKDYKDLMRMEAAVNGEPVFVIWGRSQRFRFDRPAEPEKVVVPVVPPTPVPTPTPRPVHKVRPKPTPTPEEEALASEKEFKPLNSDQQAFLMSRGYAERADNGDVIHTVKGSEETLKAIAKWYTGNEANQNELAEKNGFSTDHPLAVGARVRIPYKLVKTFKAMPKE